MNMLKITKDFNPAQLASVLVNFIGFVVLLTCVLLSPHALVYDEVYHLPLVDLLNQYGLSYRFLRGTGQSYALGNFSNFLDIYSSRKNCR